MAQLGEINYVQRTTTRLAKPSTAAPAIWRLAGWLDLGAPSQSGEPALSLLRGRLRKEGSVPVRTRNKEPTMIGVVELVGEDEDGVGCLRSGRFRAHR